MGKNIDTPYFEGMVNHIKQALEKLQPTTIYKGETSFS